MNKISVWEESKNLKLNVSSNIQPGFDVGIDEGVSDELIEKLDKFISWVTENYNLPITLWVDIQNKAYLIGEDKQRKGYLFYWNDFTDYPNFTDESLIPSLLLPAKGYLTKWSFEEILGSFIDGLTDYFAWLNNIIDEDYDFDSEADSILEKYLETLK